MPCADARLGEHTAALERRPFDVAGSHLNAWKYRPAWRPFQTDEQLAAGLSLFGSGEASGISVAAGVWWVEQ